MVRARPLLRRLVVAALVFPSVVHAGEGRVVVIEVEPRVADALVVALSPWNLAVVPAPGPRPISSFDAATSRARDIATDKHADAVVWISPPRTPNERAALWVYDAQTMGLAVRPLTVSAPFDSAGAAAIALSVKTILRSSSLLAQEPSPTDAAKLGASTAPGTPAIATGPSATPPPSAASSSAASTGAASNPPAPAPNSAATSAPGAAAPPASPTSVPAPAPPARSATKAARAEPTESEGRASGSASTPRGVWRFEAAVGARAPTGAAVEPRAALGASVWPTAWNARGGIGLEVEAGPGVSITSPTFSGELRDLSVEIAGRLRVLEGGPFSLEMQGGPALSLSSLDGEALAGSTPLHGKLQLSPAVDGGLVLDFTPFARLSLGLAANASVFVLFQRYWLNGEALLDEPTVVVFSGIRLSVEVN